MLSAEQIDYLRDRAETLLDPVVEFLLKDVARRISEAGQLTSTAQYQIWRLQNMGYSQAEIKKKLEALLGKSSEDISALLTQSAGVGYRYDLDRLPTSAGIPFENNTAIQQIVSAAVVLAKDDLTNITQTLGMVDPYGKSLPLQQAYQSCVDFAFMKVSTGAADYTTAIRQATKNLAEYGIQSIDYASGYHQSAESAVRVSVMSALGMMQEQIAKQNHDDFGCNGWEISAHAASAPDHEPIQGKQYSDADYKALNNSLVRRIGTLNCGHTAFPIILGVNAPQYTDRELEEFRKNNEKGIHYNGRHYTVYEATQRQRKLEREIRKQKRKILIDGETGDQEKLQQDQIKLQILNQEYNRFTKETGLRSQRQRAQVPGFGRKRAMSAVNAARQLEKQKELDYNQRKEGALLLIRSDKTTKRLNPGNQNKHIKESAGYIQGKSYIYGNLDFAQDLVEKYHGTGEPVFSRGGAWSNKEVVMADEVIGIAIDPKSGEESGTRRFTIHYGRKGTHVVPAREENKWNIANFTEITAGRK